MEQLTKKGAHKLLKTCTLPLTGKQCVHHVLTEFGWFDVKSSEDGSKHLVLSEIAEDESIETVKAATSADFQIAASLKTIQKHSA